MILTTFNKTDSVIQLLTLIVIFLFVILITYFTVRWMSSIQEGQGKCSNIEVIETKKITNNKYLQIVRAGEKYLLISIGKDEINAIAELDKDELLIPSKPEGKGVSFASVFDKVKSLSKKNED